MGGPRAALSPRRSPPGLPRARAGDPRALARARRLPASRCAAARAAPPWVFYEGPPTANGRPGSHHVEARVFKDIFPRYKTMRGHHVTRKGGWDCHGLPVEIAVEQQLGFTSKDDIERYGIAEFNAKCRESVFEFLEDWNALTERIGFWVDLDDAYRTLDDSYVESVWWALAPAVGEGPAVRGPQGRPVLRALRHGAVQPRGRPGLQGRRGPERLRALPGDRAGRAAARGRPARHLDDDAVDAGLQRGGRRRSRADLRAHRRRSRAGQGAGRARARRGRDDRARVRRPRDPRRGLPGAVRRSSARGVRAEGPHRARGRLRHRRRRHRHRPHRRRLRRGRLPPRRRERPHRRQPGARSTAPTTSASAPTPAAGSRTPTPT